MTEERQAVSDAKKPDFNDAAGRLALAREYSRAWWSVVGSDEFEDEWEKFKENGLAQKAHTAAMQMRHEFEIAALAFEREVAELREVCTLAEKNLTGCLNDDDVPSFVIRNMLRAALKGKP